MHIFYNIVKKTKLENISFTDVIFKLYLASFFVQMFFYFFFYIRIPFYRKRKASSTKKPVSVIICARNEADNIMQNLPGILEQNYPDFEVIVVNDCSTDDTDIVLGQLKQKYKHLKIRMLYESEKFFQGKKFALSIGIRAAKNEHLLFTDADCTVENKLWIDKMQSNFCKHKQIVLGYGGFKPHRSILNNMIRFDNFFIAIQYLSFALSGYPYMGVGRNMGYLKSLFIDNKGFNKHLKLISGDDDLFVNENATRHNISVEISPESHTRSKTKNSMREWIKQKKRHLTTGKHYNLRSKFLIGLENLSRILFYFTFIFLAISNFYYFYIFYIFAIRMLTQLIIFKLSMVRLKEKHLLIPSIAYDILFPFLNFFIFVSNSMFSNNNKW